MRTYFKVVFLLLMYQPFCHGFKPLYTSIDQHGNKQFSDIPPENRPYSIEEQPSIATVKWHKSPTIKVTSLKTKSKKRIEIEQPSKAQLCADESQQIKLLENNLKQKLKTSLFDNLKKKLRNLRWQHQKRSC